MNRSKATSLLDLRPKTGDGCVCVAGVKAGDNRSKTSLLLDVRPMHKTNDECSHLR